MELTGTLKLIKDEQVFASGFSKREFVISTEEQYPQEIVFELAKEKGALINQFKTGDRITVHFDVRGREWQGKHFVNLAAWRLQPVGATSQTETETESNIPPRPPAEAFAAPEPDDLPF